MKSPRMEKNIFDYSILSDFFKSAKILAPVIPIRQWNQKDKVFLLRHDVDLDVKPAYEISRVEEDVNVRSTFFILTTCYSYNPSSVNNRVKLLEMAEKGFEIGLHFDPLIYADERKMLKGFRVEVDILEQITGVKVSSVSLHNPSMHGRYPSFEGFNNVYEMPFFDKNFYFSDSRMGFRGKNPWKMIEAIKKDRVQILLHPMHFTDKGEGYKHIMNEFYKSFNEEVDKQFRPNNSTYKEQIPTIS